MTITIYHFLLISFILFLIGLYGIIKSKNSVIKILTSFFIIQAAIVINFLAFSKYNNNILGQVFYILILTVNSAKVVVSLAIMMVCFRKHQNDGDGFIK